eukprot:TRINITY_DN1940_c0_g2_i10.p1 TRINITY_DN1940_c0_g2~~TRINITY_DN1940_c0_g2_i10.p1  ORF type:complete len:413 (+),score=124.47 TRINITY_DN1940_c0_g2_i10:13-1251(+)
MLWLVALSFVCFSWAAPFPANYKEAADKIIAASTSESYLTFDNYEYMCDTFGPRFVGSDNLENALSWVSDFLTSEGLKVTKEPVPNITHWVRGDESLDMISPRKAKMALLGLGTSVGGDVTAEVIVVSSFDDLHKNAEKAKGKIVVYNVPFVTYSETVQYRSSGAIEAAKVGAVASLVRSITPFSLYTPHTGIQHYKDGVAKIPAAAITVEDAEMMDRMYKRGQRIVLHLVMKAQSFPDTKSWNILAEIPGKVSPQEVVVMGGHSDSWDVGQGAIDDGGGFFSAVHAVLLINKLIKEGKLPQPRRTIRAVLWVDEEVNQRGAAAYLEAHQAELKDHIIAMESDIGNFDPTTLGFSGVPEALKIIQAIVTDLMGESGVNKIEEGKGADTDNGPLCLQGVPCGSLSGTGDTGPQ